MVKIRKTDDWDITSIGQDIDEGVVHPLEKTGSLLRLVNYFREATTSSSMTLNAPVNGPALTKAFKNMREKGVTSNQMYQMIDLFAKEIKQTPLPIEVSAWRGFLAKQDKLFKLVTIGVAVVDDSEYILDSRLEKYL